MRTEESFKKYYSQLEKIKPTEAEAANLPNRPIRNRRQSTMLKDSVVGETLGQRTEPMIILQSAFFETIDIISTEMTNRFEKNDAILTAIDTADEMNLAKLQPLAELGIELPREIELSIAKEYTKNPKDKKIKTNTLTELYKVREGMPKVYNLFATIETFPSGTAICESALSALTRISRPQRITMSTNRLNNLTYLAFEYKRLQSLDLVLVLKRFNSLKDRRVQLF